MATNFLINGSEFSDNFIPRQIFTSGNLFMWGANGGNPGNVGYDGTSFGSGCLGDGQQYGGSYTSPIQVVDKGNNWKQVEAGRLTSCGIKTDGTLWTWGRNQYGQLGDNTTADKSSPVQIYGGGTNWKQVSKGHWHMAAVKTDGTLWSWGRNEYGYLGNNQGFGGSSTSSPVQTSVAGTNWKVVSCGRYTSMAIKTDGTLWGWGLAAFSGLGLSGPPNYVYTPVQTSVGGSNWKIITCGVYYGSAIKTDGTLWMWGYGNGSLGFGDATVRSTPVQLGVETNWKQVSRGDYNAAAVKTDGTLWTWGNNDNGTCGDGTTTYRSSPVQTIAGGNNWKMVSVGIVLNMAAIKTDGTLWTWGKGLGNGDGTSTDRSSPVQIYGGGTNWKHISVGNSHSGGIIDIS
jgi:alpha-tubulin suppressor-like RCC1 family protein